MPPAAFVRELNIPAYMNGAGRGTLPPGDPHHFQQTRRYAFDHADVILIVGTPFDFRMGYGKRLRRDATVVQIDLDYRTVGKNRDIELGLVGDCGADPRRRDPGRIRAQGHRRERPGRLAQRAADRGGEAGGGAPAEAQIRREPDPPAAAGLRAQRASSTENTIFIGDGGDVVTFAGGVVKPHSPGHWMDPGPLGTLGVGVPFAMAAKFTQPKKEVLCLFGDGAFSLTGWDFETCVRFKLPFIGVVGNNSAMNQIRYGQIQKYGPERGDVGNKLGDVPYYEVRRDAGRLWRGGPRAGPDPTGAGARPRVRQGRAHQRLGRSRTPMRRGR